MATTRDPVSGYADTWPTRRTPAPPIDPDHSLRVGWVAGVLAAAAEHEPLSGIKTRAVELVNDEHGHLDAIRLHAPSGTYLVSVERESYS